MVTSERLYRGAGRPAVIRKRDKSLVSKYNMSRHPVGDVTTTYGGTPAGVDYEIRLLLAYLNR